MEETAARATEALAAAAVTYDIVRFHPTRESAFGEPSRFKVPFCNTLAALYP
jgi:hypothetical protein